MSRTQPSSSGLVVKQPHFLHRANATNTQAPKRPLTPYGHCPELLHSCKIHQKASPKSLSYTACTMIIHKPRFNHGKGGSGVRPATAGQSCTLHAQRFKETAIHASGLLIFAERTKVDMTSFLFGRAFCLHSVCLRVRPRLARRLPVDKPLFRCDGLNTGRRLFGSARVGSFLSLFGLRSWIFRLFLLRAVISGFRLFLVTFRRAACRLVYIPD